MIIMYDYNYNLFIYFYKFLKLQNYTKLYSIIQIITKFYYKFYRYIQRTEQNVSHYQALPNIG